MHGASWLLIALAFALGLAMTFAVMIRRVEGEVPPVAPASADAAKSEPPTDTPVHDADEETS
jgi:hypothetical protein